jgi:hypothetical protein
VPAASDERERSDSITDWRALAAIGHVDRAFRRIGLAELVVPYRLRGHAAGDHRIGRLRAGDRRADEKDA